MNGPDNSCRHCGTQILPHAAGWVHEHGLYRCQESGRPYGYEARGDDGFPCACWACERFGSTSPLATTEVAP